MPDIESKPWFLAKKKQQRTWTVNSNATGDSYRKPAEGHAPKGWSSWQPTEASATPTSSALSASVSSSGTGRISTWSRQDLNAVRLMTTLDPATGRDGGPDLVPK